MLDSEDDVRDAILFRFWCRMAAEQPSRTANALVHCLSPEDFRRALVGLATEAGVNLPE